MIIGDENHHGKPSKTLFKTNVWQNTPSGFISNLKGCLLIIRATRNQKQVTKNTRLPIYPYVCMYMYKTCQRVLSANKIQKSNFGRLSWTNLQKKHCLRTINVFIVNVWDGRRHVPVLTVPTENRIKHSPIVWKHTYLLWSSK